jgi:hypothetical protein
VTEIFKNPQQFHIQTKFKKITKNQRTQKNVNISCFFSQEISQKIILKKYSFFTAKNNKMSQFSSCFLLKFKVKFKVKLFSLWFYWTWSFWGILEFGGLLFV